MPAMWSFIEVIGEVINYLINDREEPVCSGIAYFPKARWVMADCTALPCMRAVMSDLTIASEDDDRKTFGYKQLRKLISGTRGVFGNIHQWIDEDGVAAQSGDESNGAVV